MNKKIFLPILLAIGGLAFALRPLRSEERRAKAKLKDGDGKPVASATLVEKRDGVHFTLIGSGLPPGLHGFHIHEKGACQAPTFDSSGGHFNPFHKKHGLKNKDGPHAGDLPNLPVNELGTVEFTFVTPRVTLGPGKNSLLAGVGTCLVIHAGADDERTDPAGNSGARIACGMIEKQ